MKYAMLLADGDDRKDGAQRKQHIENIVKGIIEGETRVLVSSMSMEEIFTEREEFKRRIFRSKLVSYLRISDFGCLSAFASKTRVDSAIF